MKIEAAVVRSTGAPFEIETLDLEDPGSGEILVRIVATGICHADVNVQNQAYPTPLPVVLGHEGAGIVEQVGPGVKTISPGDHVVLTFGACGQCPSCAGGKVAYCWHHMEMNFSGKRYSGKAWDVDAPFSRLIENDGGPARRERINGAFFQQSSFATYAIATEANAVVVGRDDPLEFLAPLGCGFQTGAGAVLNTLKPRAGASLLVTGAGSVGLAAVMGAAISDCASIIVVDTRADRLELATKLGATHTILADGRDINAEVRKNVDAGVEFSIETTGNPGVFRQAVEALQTGGVCGLIGGAKLGTDVRLDMTHLLFGRTVRGILQGDSDRKTFIPELISLYRQGKFPIDKLIKPFPFKDINKAIESMKSGDAVKPVLVMQPAMPKSTIPSNTFFE